MAVNTDTDSRIACYDCERRFRRRDIQTVEVMITHDDGMGYDDVPVPLCSDCRGRRRGFPCPQCGLAHSSKDEAQSCCVRAPGDAPDCPECGRRMERTAWGYTADGKPTCEFAECEACSIGWGRFTGWHQLEDDETQEESDA